MGRMRTCARTRYAGYRFPAEIIGHAVWLYFRFPLGLRMVEELLAARGIIVSHETVRAAKREIMPGIEHRQHKDVSATLTTIVLDDSSLRWIETCT